jgi:DNA/RNA endonuclease YhcR with UshA esterase domain
MKWLGPVVAVGLVLALCMPCSLVMAQDEVKTDAKAEVKAEAKAEAKPGAAAKAITWREAMGKVGEDVVVEGTVVDIKIRTGKGPDTLNFDKNWKESLSVAIFNKEKFGDVQAKYQGKKIRVSGKVSEYKDAAQIKVKDPAQITIVE